MLGTKPGAVRSGRKYANHCATLPLLVEDFIVMLVSLELGFNLLSRAKRSKTNLKDRDALLFTKRLVILADSSIFLTD